MATIPIDIDEIEEGKRRGIVLFCKHGS